MKKRSDINYDYSSVKQPITPISIKMKVLSKLMENENLTRELTDKSLLEDIDFFVNRLMFELHSQIDEFISMDRLEDIIYDTYK